MGKLISMKEHVAKLGKEPILTKFKLEKYMDSLNSRVLCGVAKPAEVDMLNFLVEYSGESRLMLDN